MHLLVHIHCPVLQPLAGWVAAVAEQRGIQRLGLPLIQSHMLWDSHRGRFMALVRKVSEWSPPMLSPSLSPWCGLESVPEQLRTSSLKVKTGVVPTSSAGCLGGEQPVCVRMAVFHGQSSNQDEKGFPQKAARPAIWVWLKMKRKGQTMANRRFWSMFPLTRATHFTGFWRELLGSFLIKMTGLPSKPRKTRHKMGSSFSLSGEAAGEAVYSALFEAAPSLQSLFKTPRAAPSRRRGASRSGHSPRGGRALFFFFSSVQVGWA